MATWNNSREQNPQPQIYPPLEEKCIHCVDGVREEEGVITFPEGYCGVCDSTGWVLTDFGETMLEFLKKYLKVQTKIG